MDSSVRLYRRLDQWLIDLPPLQYGLLLGVLWIIIFTAMYASFWTEFPNPVIMAVGGALIVGGLSGVGKTLRNQYFRTS